MNLLIRPVGHLKNRCAFTCALDLTPRSSRGGLSDTPVEEKDLFDDDSVIKRNLRACHPLLPLEERDGVRRRVHALLWLPR